MFAYFSQASVLNPDSVQRGREPTGVGANPLVGNNRTIKYTRKGHHQLMQKTVRWFSLPR